MKTVLLPCRYTSLSQQLLRYLEASISLCTIPKTTERIALNFRHSPYLTHRSGPHPLEVHLFRGSPEETWKIATMTSFAFPSDEDGYIPDLDKPVITSTSLRRIKRAVTFDILTPYK